MHQTMFAELNRRRSSARAFARTPVDDATIEALFDAVRWAQSSYNDQPWRFLIATPEDGSLRAELEACLFPGNAFAADGWVLGVVFACTTFEKDGRVNAHALFDCGAACQVLALQACDLDLSARFLAGFDMERARALGRPHLQPVVMFVVGHPAPAAHRAASRQRKPLRDIVVRQPWHALDKHM